MFENRSLKLDLFALALLAIVVFLTLALVTYDPADPIGELVTPLNQLYQPDQLVYPQNESVKNSCGRSGAVIADMMFMGLGVGAYYLLFSLAIVDILLLRRMQIDTPLVRAIGWTVSLFGFVTIVNTVFPNLAVGPVVGPGGYLGALGRGVFELHFARLGALVLSFSLFVAGLLLCTDYVLISIATGAFRFVSRGVAATGLRSERRAASAEHDGEDQDDEEDQEEFSDGDAGVSITVSGKKISTSEIEADDDEEEDEEEWETDEVDEEEEAPAPRVKRKLKKQADGPKLKRKKKESSEREQVMTELDEAANRVEDATDYELPAMDLLVPGDEVSFDQQAKEVRRKARLLEKTFASFGFQVKVVEVETGPVIAQYEVALESGLRLSKITGLADDVAIALRVPSVRIVAPIPGKNTVGIEVPNDQRQVVRLREVIEESEQKVDKMGIPIFLGKDVSGNALTVDLAKLPHLLIAGRTGTGKSVCLNAIISSILMTRRPDEVRMLMIDPKMVELSGYGRLPHLMHPVVTDMRKAEAILAWAVDKMEERYSLLAKAGVRHVSSYNQLGADELVERLQVESDEQRESIPLHLPYIVIVADEMADLMMTAGKEVEQHIIRLAQKSRAVGIHLILATQKPTVDVITGLIKSNLPARISFQVASRTDSRVVLDEMGADKLLGNGDMLFLYPGTSSLLRGQGTYLSDDEINSICDSASTGEQNFVNELMNIKVEDPNDGGAADPSRREDDLYESAIEIVIREGRGSVSLLQRALGIGYGRAARLIDYMEQDGIVGQYAGSQAREILITMADWERMQGIESEDEDEPSNRISRGQGWEDETAEAGCDDEEDVADAEEEEYEEEYEEVDSESNADEYDSADYEDEEGEYEDEEGEYEDEEGEYEEGEYEEEDENEYEEEDEDEEEVVVKARHTKRQAKRA